MLNYTYLKPKSLRLGFFLMGYGLLSKRKMLLYLTKCEGEFSRVRLEQFPNPTRIFRGSMCGLIIRFENPLKFGFKYLIIQKFNILCGLCTIL